MSESQRKSLSSSKHNKSKKKTSKPTQTTTNTSTNWSSMPDQFTPDDIIQMQRTIGNQAVQRLMLQRKEQQTIQREDEKPDGLIDLGGGFRGEVGIEGKIKSGSTVTQIGGKGDYKVTADAHAFVHDISDKDKWFVQIPGYVVDYLASDKKKTVKKAKDDLNNKKVGKEEKGNVTTYTDSDPVRGTIPKARVSTAGAKLEHLPTSQPLFPEGGAKPEHIEQRELGNCYFLSALGSVAIQYPSYLESMMTDNGKTVTVRFYRPKEDGDGFDQENVTVTKSVVKSTDFSFSKRGQGKYSATHVPWPALATKAYAAWSGHAKAALPGFGGTYEGVAGGKAHVVFEHILGQSSTKEDITKNKIDGFVGREDGDDGNWIIPGHPKRPKVALWNSKLKRDFSFFANASDFQSYLQDNDEATNQEKMTAYLNQKVLAGTNIAFNDVTFKPMGPMYKVSIKATKILQGLADGLSDDDAGKWVAFLNSGDGVKMIDEATTIGKADSVMDAPSLKAIFKAAGLSEDGANVMFAASAGMYIGTPDQPIYRPEDIAMHDRIKKHIEDGGLVNSGTPDYGKKGGGISGGEDTVSVPGIAGGHSYTVLGASQDGDRRFVKLMNPWGKTGRGYSKDFKKGSKIKAGTFNLELGEFVRYFSDVQYSTGDTSVFGVDDISDQSNENDE